MHEQILVIMSITFLAMISPGPDMMIVMRNTLIDGRRAGLDSSLGVLAGNAIHITYCLLGIGLLISQSILAFNILKYAGALYIIYLGIMSFRSGTSITLDKVTASNTKSNKSWLIQGFLSNILNPKGTLFYLSVFTLVITPETSLGTTVILILCMKSVSASFWVVFVYTLDRQTVRKWLQRSQQLVNRVFGAILIGLGLKILVQER